MDLDGGRGFDVLFEDVLEVSPPKDMRVRPECCVGERFEAFGDLDDVGEGSSPVKWGMGQAV